MFRFSPDDTIALLFLLVSGGALLFGDLILLITWPMALAGILFSRWYDDQGVARLCCGIPLVVAVGYLSIPLMVVSALLLIALATGPENLLSGWMQGIILSGGSVLALLSIPGTDPFRVMLIVLILAVLLSGVLYLLEHAVARTVRGDGV
ncbi:hypothetical protein RJ53_04730 [Methanocalculus chunghsingensis]|uniref:Uncharacterized protein n=1 Tax=Methanocalculus chunghsingensis TaxID=156457 RepID=A0A8J7W9V9_9EURY|nr:hypothetical protein [Methanocalculus chunghsingensis]MBR1368853.1 hypothetical protein [Methanocalculus chunghsingensis]